MYILCIHSNKYHYHWPHQVQEPTDKPVKVFVTMCSRVLTFRGTHCKIPCHAYTVYHCQCSFSYLCKDTQKHVHLISHLCYCNVHVCVVVHVLLRGYNAKSLFLLKQMYIHVYTYIMQMCVYSVCMSTKYYTSYILCIYIRISYAYHVYPSFYTCVCVYIHKCRSNLPLSGCERLYQILETFISL